MLTPVLAGRYAYQTHDMVEYPSLITKKKEQHFVAEIPLMRPALIRRKANEIPANTNDITNKFDTNYYFIRKCGNHSFRFYSKILIQGIFESDSNPDIVNLCALYLHDTDDQTHELAFILYKTLTKMRKKSISRKILSKIIQHWFKLKKHKSADLFINNQIDQLLAAKYMVSYHGYGCQSLFKFSISSEMGFAGQ